MWVVNLQSTACVCFFCFCVGLIFCTGAGEYWLKMFDSFAGTIGLVVIALMESIAVIYIYGHERCVMNGSRNKRGDNHTLIFLDSPRISFK